VWFGVSAENQERADERIPLLLSIPAVIHWISAEPLIGPIDLSYHLNPLFPPKPYGAGIDWVVVGGESGPQARPMLTEWARSLRDQCLLREIPFFFKQWGEHREHVLLTGGWMPNTAEIERALRAGEMDFGGFDDKQRKYLDLGKKLNGRDLDGIEWSQFPEVTR
jgi:protein gp37